MAGTPYPGIASNIAPPAPVAIASVTNPNLAPYVVSTAPNAHGLNSGDWVDVSAVSLALQAANGIWQVTFIDSQHYSLNGSSGNGGAGGVGGNSQALTFTGNVSLNPVNGDPYDASTYIPGMSCLADRTAFLAKSLGAYKIVSEQFTIHNDSGAGIWTQLATATTGTFQDFGTLVTFPAQNSGNLVSGDLILFDFTFSLDFDKGANTPSFAQVALFFSQEPIGAAPSYTKVDGTSRYFLTGVHTSPIGSNAQAISMTGIVQVGISAGQGLFKLQTEWSGGGGGSTTTYLLGDYHWRAIVLRPTTWPQ